MFDSSFIVTTSLSPTRRMKSLARELSDRLGFPYSQRSKRGLGEIASSGTGAIVVEAESVVVHMNGSDFRYHPNVAKLRIIQLMRGGRDRMVDAMRLSPGDTVLDCTCGLGADATVASFVAGERGTVRALEASKVLAELVSLGLQTYDDPLDQLVKAMRRVRVSNVSYQDFLRTSRDKDYDIVYFDPMFEVTYEDSAGLDLVRMIGLKGTPRNRDIQEAVRVARRRVVMKDRTPGDRLRALGFAAVSCGRKTCFGSIDV